MIQTISTMVTKVDVLENQATELERDMASLHIEVEHISASLSSFQSKLDHIEGTLSKIDSIAGSLAEIEASMCDLSFQRDTRLFPYREKGDDIQTSHTMSSHEVPGSSAVSIIHTCIARPSRSSFMDRDFTLRRLELPIFSGDNVSS